MDPTLDILFYKNLCLCLWLRAMKIYQKLHKFSSSISFFCTRQWKFSNQNVQQLWNAIREEDRKIFDFSLRNLNWNRYLGESLMGLRTFLLKDDPNKLSEAIKKRNRWVFSGSWFIIRGRVK
jgi:fatty acyl-CoA reductase